MQGINLFMNALSSCDIISSELRDQLSLVITRRLLPIEEGPWFVEGTSISARMVPNAKAQPAATGSIEVAFEGVDGWTIVVRAALCQGKLWQPERWIHIHDFGDANGRAETEVMAAFAEWVEAI